MSSLLLQLCHRIFSIKCLMIGVIQAISQLAYASNVMIYPQPEFALPNTKGLRLQQTAAHTHEASSRQCRQPLYLHYSPLPSSHWPCSICSSTAPGAANGN